MTSLPLYELINMFSMCVLNSSEIPYGEVSILFQVAVSNSDMNQMESELEKLRDFKEKVEAKSLKR